MLCLLVVITKTVYCGHTTLKEFSIYLHTNKRRLVTKRNTNEVKNWIKIHTLLWDHSDLKFAADFIPSGNPDYETLHTRLFQACIYLKCVFSKDLCVGFVFSVIGREQLWCRWHTNQWWYKELYTQFAICSNLHYVMKWKSNGIFCW